MSASMSPAARSVLTNCHEAQQSPVDTVVERAAAMSAATLW